MLPINGKSHHYQISIAMSFNKLQNKHFTNPKTVKEYSSL